MELKKRISEEVEKLLNERIKGEYQSAYIYWAMSNWCDCYGFFKAKDKYRKYGDEEISHARKLEDYINDRNGKVVLQVIPVPQQEFKSLLDVITKSYEHEQVVTDNYTKLASAIFNTDKVTFAELQWFVTEQIEEEAKFADAIIFANRLGITDETTGVELAELEDFLTK